MKLSPEAYRPVKFEAKKHAARQLQDSHWQLVLTLHPDDIPTWLIMAPNGTHLQIEAQAMTDEGSPQEPARGPKTTGERAVQQAGLLCKEERFQAYLASMMPDVVEGDTVEDATATRLRKALGIETRKELELNEVAQTRFADLLNDFMAWAKKKSLI